MAACYVVVVVVAYHLFYSCQASSRLRKSATVFGLSRRSWVVSCHAGKALEQMFNGVWCHSTVRMNTCNACSDAGLVGVH